MRLRVSLQQLVASQRGPAAGRAAQGRQGGHWGTEQASIRDRGVAGPRAGGPQGWQRQEGGGREEGAQGWEGTVTAEW